MTAEQWLSTNPAVLAVFDFNGNGVIDVGDMLIVAANLQV
jgi:hypothetical protein